MRFSARPPSPVPVRPSTRAAAPRPLRCPCRGRRRRRRGSPRPEQADQSRRRGDPLHRSPQHHRQTKEGCAGPASMSPRCDSMPAGLSAGPAASRPAGAVDRPGAGRRGAGAAAGVLRERGGGPAGGLPLDGGVQPHPGPGRPGGGLARRAPRRGPGGGHQRPGLRPPRRHDTGRTGRRRIAARRITLPWPDCPTPTPTPRCPGCPSQRRTGSSTTSGCRLKGDGVHHAMLGIAHCQSRWNTSVSGAIAWSAGVPSRCWK